MKYNYNGTTKRKDLFIVFISPFLYYSIIIYAIRVSRYSESNLIDSAGKENII